MSKIEAEVTHLRQSLDKRLDGGATESEIEDVLTALGKVAMSIDLLRSTKVGKSVTNVLRAAESRSVKVKFSDQCLTKCTVHVLPRASYDSNNMYIYVYMFIICTYICMCIQLITYLLSSTYICMYI